MARRRRRRRHQGPPVFRILLAILVLAAGVYFGGKVLLSPKGRYVTAQKVWRGKTSRVKPVLEEALARAARDLRLPPPSPQLFCEPDSITGQVVCRSTVSLTPQVSPVQGNAAFTRELTDLGLELITGVEQPGGSVHLSYQAGERMQVMLQLLPAESTGLDTVVTPAPELPSVPVTCRLALIVNEYGENAGLSRGFEALPGRLTAAIHTELPEIERWTASARGAGMEILINLPMEPRNFPNYDPGPNAVLVDLSGRAIRKLIDRAADRVEGAVGVKTYMGQLAVEDRDVMRAVLEQVKKKELFFVDATFEEYSTTRNLAREIDLPVLVLDENSQDIDRNRRDAGTVGIRFDDWVTRCRARGYGVGIVHVKQATLTVLEQRLPALAREGVVVMGLEEVLRAMSVQ